MLHVKLRPGTATDAASLSRLIETAYSDANDLGGSGDSDELFVNEIADAQFRKFTAVPGIFTPPKGRSGAV
jgi:predicted TIM-barrel enzyme